jgi:hypothetical protein
VDDDVAEVNQHPAGVYVALPTEGPEAIAAQRFVQGIQQGLHLTDVHRRGDDEVVGESRDLTDVEKQDVLRLLLGQQVNDAPGEVGSSQKAPSESWLGAL